MRLNKYIAKSGVCSRRKADELIDSGQVLINGKIAAKGQVITEGDIVKVDGTVISLEEEKIYLAFNKPVDIVCTSNTKLKNNIIDYIDYPKRIYTVGRLDANSEGLILLTNDGDFSEALTNASNQHEKEYLVTVYKDITDEFIKNMETGVEIDGKMTAPCKVKKLSNRKFKITLIQGLNRQIRKMCISQGNRVKTLKRIRIGKLLLSDLKTGEYKSIHPKDVL